MSAFHRLAQLFLPLRLQRLHPTLRWSNTHSARGMSTLTPVFAQKGVHPIGPYYSQAITCNGFVFLSGQIPATYDGKLIEGSVADKSRKMIENAGHVLEAAGTSLEKVVKVNLYFRDMNDQVELNKVYTEYFPQRPARSSCEVTKVPAGASMEMDLIAAV